MARNADFGHMGLGNRTLHPYPNFPPSGTSDKISVTSNIGQFLSLMGNFTVINSK